MSSLRSVIIVAAEPFFLMHLGSRKKVTPAPARAARTNPRKKKPTPTPPPAAVSPLPTALPSAHVGAFPEMHPFEVAPEEGVPSEQTGLAPLPHSLPLPPPLPPPVAVLPVSSGRDGAGAKDARPCVRREFEHMPLGSYLGEGAGVEVVVSISSIQYAPDEIIFVWREGLSAIHSVAQIDPAL